MKNDLNEKIEDMSGRMYLVRGSDDHRPETEDPHPWRNDAVLCRACDEPIARARLMRVPDARYCLECQQEFEALQRRVRPRSTAVY